MNNPKVSIILPTYNVERFLLQCLDSIAAQTYKNIEVIIVIDGATDGSYQIAKDFCKKDDRFKVFWQENAGSGPARNHGIDESTGELIMFVDPDDWCKPDYVEKMVLAQQEKDYDLVTTGETSVYFNSKGQVKKCIEPNAKSIAIFGIDKVRENYVDLFSKGLIQAPHCKIYKTIIIKNNNIRFPDLRRSQDVVFNYQYYGFLQTILISDVSGHMYRVINKERALRLPIGYEKNIKLIYDDIKRIHLQWNVSFNVSNMCTSLFGGVYALFEATLLRKGNIKTIIEEPTIYEIIQNAFPNKVHLVLIKYMIVHGFYHMASLMILLIFRIKSIVH